MKNDSDYKSIILEELNKGPASIKTLKQKCGQGNKISNLRKSFHNLLKNGSIQFEGYDSSEGIFKLDNIIFKKSNSNKDNPTYVKELLDNLIEDNNYHEIRKIFHSKVEEINKIYNEELEHLKRINGKISVKKALELGYFEPKENCYYYTPRKSMSLIEILDKDPQAYIFYLKEHFVSKIGFITSLREINGLYFGYDLKINYGTNSCESYIEDFKKFFNHFPLTKSDEELFLRNWLLKDLKEEKGLWDLAFYLTEPNNASFTDELRCIEFIYEEIHDKMNEHRYI